MRRLLLTTTALLTLLVPVTASGAIASAPPSRVADGPTAAAKVRLPPVNGQVDYQLGGAYRPRASVDVVTRDRTADPVPGRYNICYVNAYQTQPGELGFWKRQHPRALLRDDDGDLVTDQGYPDEVLLDTSTKQRRHTIAGVVGRWFAGCAREGFRAVEPDNLDSWTRFEALLSRSGNLALARLLAARAHRLGLAIAQKNAAGVASRGREIGFDFAVAEECQVYDECGTYTRAYGRHLIEIEYTDNGRKAYATACERRGRTTSVLLRDRDVVTPRSPRYVYRTC